MLNYHAIKLFPGAQLRSKSKWQSWVKCLLEIHVEKLA